MRNTTYKRRMKKMLSLYQCTLMYTMSSAIATIHVCQYLCHASPEWKKECLVVYMKTSNPSQFHVIFHSNQDDAEKTSSRIAHRAGN